MGNDAEIADVLHLYVNYRAARRGAVSERAQTPSGIVYRFAGRTARLRPTGDREEPE